MKSHTHVLPLVAGIITVMIMLVSIIACQDAPQQADKSGTEIQVGYEDLSHTPEVMPFQQYDVLKVEEIIFMANKNNEIRYSDIIDYTNGQLDLDKGTRETMQSRCSGSKTCNLTCGRTTYVITGIPDECSCAATDGASLTITCTRCPSKYLVCTSK